MPRRSKRSQWRSLDTASPTWAGRLNRWAAVIPTVNCVSIARRRRQRAQLESTAPDMDVVSLVEATDLPSRPSSVASVTKTILRRVDEDTRQRSSTENCKVPHHEIVLGTGDRDR